MQHIFASLNIPQHKQCNTSLIFHISDLCPSYKPSSCTQTFFLPPLCWKFNLVHARQSTLPWVSVSSPITACTFWFCFFISLSSCSTLFISALVMLKLALCSGRVDVLATGDSLPNKLLWRTRRAVFVSWYWCLALGKLQIKGNNKNIKFTKIKSLQDW